MEIIIVVPGEVSASNDPAATEGVDHHSLLECTFPDEFLVSADESASTVADSSWNKGARRVFDFGEVSNVRRREDGTALQYADSQRIACGVQVFGERGAGRSGTDDENIDRGSLGQLIKGVD
jgi:hypothetical protein